MPLKKESARLSTLMFFVSALLILFYFFLIGLKNFFRYTSLSRDYKMTVLNIKRMEADNSELKANLKNFENSAFMKMFISKKLSYTELGNQVFVFY